ncbi:MAG: hypothetical protein OXU66_10285 [Gammaproteobacteria bacterium]|nr:hypothetical protein [Gammaproteobacteria bacterium]MDD9895073.1 hypothetical protein [Gammaproteobacteria bacterium]MDD9959318.1 hypothetical protein [Gammaproteobacteria bacterium]
MNKLLLLSSFVLVLSGCEWWEAQYDRNAGLPEIRSQADVDAYNATVSSESEKLVCERERVVGSNIRQWVCLTQAQRDRLALEGRENVEQARTILDN